MFGGISLGPEVENVLRTHLAVMNSIRYFNEPRSFVLIYEHNAIKTNTRHVVLGERQDGDALLHQQSKLVKKNSNRFAESDLNAEQSEWSITCVEFSFDVS